MLHTLSYEELAALVGTKFVITEEPSSPIELELVSINERRGNERQEYFSLYFLGTPELILPQKIYALTHEKLGAGELFLVPVAKTAQGVEYEAAFNRLIEDKQT